MTSIDPLRRSAVVRRTRKSEAETADDAQVSEGSNMLVPVSPAQTVPPRPGRIGGDSALHAQVIGERRGLRAGAGVHDEAKASYVKTEYSGAWDRRRPKGRAAKKEI
ncbi:MAG: hypothetical protein ACXWKN_15355 [Phenylobacterium sp.]